MSHHLKTGPGSECGTIKAKVVKGKPILNRQILNTTPDALYAESPNDEIHEMAACRMRATKVKSFRNSKHVLTMEGRKSKLSYGFGRGLVHYSWLLDLAPLLSARQN